MSQSSASRRNFRLPALLTRRQLPGWKCALHPLQLELAQPGACLASMPRPHPKTSGRHWRCEGSWSWGVGTVQVQVQVLPGPYYAVGTPHGTYVRLVNGRGAGGRGGHLGTPAQRIASHPWMDCMPASASKLQQLLGGSQHPQREHVIKPLGCMGGLNFHVLHSTKYMLQETYYAVHSTHRSFLVTPVHAHLGTKRKLELHTSSP